MPDTPSYAGSLTLDDLNVAAPDGSTEAPSIIDDAIKSVKRCLLNSIPWQCSTEAANFTPVIGDGGIYLVSGDTTADLAAMANKYTGLILYFIKMDSAATTMTIDQGAVNINGDSTAITVNVPFGIISVVYDGTDWVRLDQTIFNDNAFKIVDETDGTKTLTFSLSNLGTGEDVTINLENQTGDVTINIPDAGAGDTIVLEDAAQTLTNKTLTGATLTGVTLTASGWPSFSANTGGTILSIPDSVETTLEFDTEVFDTNSNFNTSTFAFTPTVAGKYLLTATAGASNWSNGVWGYLLLHNTNGSVDLQRFLDISTMVGDFLAFTCTKVVNANGSSDSFIAKFYQNSGGSLSLAGDTFITNFSGCKVG